MTSPVERRAHAPDAVTGRLAGAGLDGLFVTRLSNIEYLTGFTGSTAAAYVSAGRRAIVVDFRYLAQVKDDLCLRADVSYKEAQNLVKCGAMDSLAERQFLLSNIEELQRYAKDVGRRIFHPKFINWS